MDSLMVIIVREYRVTLRRWRVISEASLKFANVAIIACVSGDCRVAPKRGAEGGVVCTKQLVFAW